MPGLIEKSLPYSDEVYNGMYLGPTYAENCRILVDDKFSEEAKDLAFRGISRQIADARKLGAWYTGETRVRPEPEVEPIEEEPIIFPNWIRRDDPDTPTNFDDHEPFLTQEPEIAPEVPQYDPAFEDKPNDWKVVSTLKGHARNADRFGRENRVNPDGSKNWLPESMWAVGIIAGATSVLAVHGLATEPVMNLLDAAHTPFVLKLLTGAVTTGLGNYVLNQKLFLDTMVRKWIAPKVSESIARIESGERGIEEVGLDTMEKMERDENEMGIVSTIALGDLVGKLTAGLALTVTSFLHPSMSASHAPDHPQDYGTSHQPTTEVTPTPPNPNMGGDHTPGGVTPQIPAPEPTLPTHEVIVHTPDVSAGPEYIIKPDDQMLQVFLDQNVTDHVYSSQAAIDFLKLNHDTLLQAWANKYGERGVPMLDSDGKSVRYTIEQMRVILDRAIGRGGSPTQEWSATIREPFNDIMNALRGIPVGTKVILPVETY
ncbi:MAG: hypothetical protein WAV40_02825 [Microgenomates group bacterium]